MRNFLFLFIAALFAAGAVACDRNIGVPPPEQHPNSAFVVRVSVAPQAVTIAAGEGVLFVGARPAAGGPPIYVARYAPAFFPGTYYLTESNRMGIGGGPVDGPMVVFARFDRDGDASSRSTDDLEAAAEPAHPGNTQIGLMLNRAAPVAAVASAWSLAVRLDGPTPPQGTLFVLLRAAAGGRVPLAAARYAVPASFPLTVTLSEAHVIQPPLPPLDQLEVVVKVDQDGNPMSTVTGDLEGSAMATAIAAGAVLRLTPAVPR